uniref:Uncharacterized protein n=1 Tax=Arundo donax TaxID=35708 RepID=A0A0A9FGA4_ARUDO
MLTLGCDAHKHATTASFLLPIALAAAPSAAPSSSPFFLQHLLFAVGSMVLPFLLLLAIVVLVTLRVRKESKACSIWLLDEVVAYIYRLGVG